jgi:excisionase family DNA binding protein
MSCIESVPRQQITVAEYAAVNKVCPATVYRLIAAGKLPARRLGRAIIAISVVAPPSHATRPVTIPAGRSTVMTTS